MLFLLRNIRRKLMTRNNIATYLLYALGEIFLVVVGILIAVSIDDWTEQNKKIEEEKATIASLELELKKNLSALKGDISANKLIIKTCEYLLNYTGPNYKVGTLNNPDSIISNSVRMSIWDPSTYTLDDIKNAGKLSDLSNDSLKNLLIDWDSFNANLKQWSDFYVNGGNKYFDFLLKHSINKNMSFVRSPNGSIPSKSRFKGSNEALLLTNLEFENQLTHKADLSSFMLGYYLQAEEKLERIIKECETYKE